MAYVILSEQSNGSYSEKTTYNRQIIIQKKNKKKTTNFMITITVFPNIFNFFVVELNLGYFFNDTPPREATDSTLTYETSGWLRLSATTFNSPEMRAILVEN